MPLKFDVQFNEKGFTVIPEQDRERMLALCKIRAGTIGVLIIGEPLELANVVYDENKDVSVTFKRGNKNDI